MKKQKLLWTFAAVFALLGTVLLNIAGMRFSGALFWCAALVVIAYAVLSRSEKKSAKWARRALAALVCAGVLLFAWCEAQVIAGAFGDAEGRDVSCVVILGAGVNGTEPSLMLSSRLETALAYLSDKPDVPVICTGGKGTGENLSEAECMRRWLVGRGVDESRILLEDRAVNTQENFTFSFALMRENGIDPEDGFAFVSSDYHLARARRLADTDASCAVAAHLERSAYCDALQLNYYVREAFAMAKLLVIGG